MPYVHSMTAKEHERRPGLRGFKIKWSVLVPSLSTKTTYFEDQVCFLQLGGRRTGFVIIYLPGGRWFDPPTIACRTAQMSGGAIYVLISVAG